MNLSDLVFGKYDCRDVSIYATSEVIDDFICDNAILLDEVEDLCLLDDEEYVTLSRCCFDNGEEEWFLEELIREDGRQFRNETEVLIVEEGIVDIVDFSKIGFEDLELLEVLNTNDDEIDEEDDWLEELTHDLIDELSEISEGDCIHCIIKKYLKLVEKVIKDCTLDDVIESISKL